MQTDVDLKVLFRRFPDDLARLTGDLAARVLSFGVLELQEIKRAVDCVMKLQRGRERYYRHVEFQAKPDPRMAERCFRYNSQLLLQLHAPVLTTVLYLFPPGPKSGS